MREVSSTNINGDQISRISGILHIVGAPHIILRTWQNGSLREYHRCVCVCVCDQGKGTVPRLIVVQISSGKKKKYTHMFKYVYVQCIYRMCMPLIASAAKIPKVMKY